MKAEPKNIDSAEYKLTDSKKIQSPIHLEADDFKFRQLSQLINKSPEVASAFIRSSSGLRDEKIILERKGGM